MGAAFREAMDVNSFVEAWGVNAVVVEAMIVDSIVKTLDVEDGSVDAFCNALEVDAPVVDCGIVCGAVAEALILGMAVAEAFVVEAAVEAWVMVAAFVKAWVVDALVE